jgi:hypothetical protein
MPFYQQRDIFSSVTFLKTVKVTRSIPMCSQDNRPLRLPLILLLIIVLSMDLCPALNAGARDLLQKEKITMATASSQSLPPLDLRAPTIIETASFALG